VSTTTNSGRTRASDVARRPRCTLTTSAASPRRLEASRQLETFQGSWRRLPSSTHLVQSDEPEDSHFVWFSEGGKVTGAGQ